MSFLVPDGVLLAAAGVVLQVPALRASLPAAARLFPTTVYVVGALLAWRLARGRLFFATVALALSTAALHLPESGLFERTVWDAVSVLLPLNLAILALRPDRGIFTRAGLVTFGVMALEVVAVVLAARNAPVQTTTLLEHPLFTAPWIPRLHLIQVGVLAFAVALAAAAAPLVFETDPMDRSFVWAIIASLAAVLARHVPMPLAPLANLYPGPASGIFLGTAGLILVVVTAESSHRLAYLDALTGLPGRRALVEALQQLGGTFAVAMIDVDHFKRFNDHYGHDAGDQILKMVATKLSKVDGEGRAYRYGGEEFAIVFPDRTTADTLPYIEAVRRAIADTRFIVRRRLRRKRGAGKPSRTRPVAVAVTISAGLADTKGQRSTPDEVLRTADRALYAAKEGGRNQVRA
ncbi:MAG TPA: GGDEF domain-containing protein [Gemmatimonadales bacterium]|nr:GGDEF domain-containing protein [Gemmatimonadales bacterium]